MKYSVHLHSLHFFLFFITFIVLEVEENIIKGADRYLKNPGKLLYHCRAAGVKLNGTAC